MELVLSNFDLYLSAFRLTIGLFLVSAVGSLLLGTLLAAMRVGPIAFMSKAATVYITVVRNTPLLIIFVFVIIGLPKLGILFRSVEELGISSFFFRACLALTLYTSTFVAEAIRSGINAVPLGQAEAARAIGLTFGGTMTQVVLPQAFRATVPPMASVFIALLKNTSVAYAFGILEATARMKYFTNISGNDLPIFLIFAAGYVVLVEIVSFGAHRLERRLERGAMSQTSVLFDVAGPRTRARHRIYTVISLVVILGLAALLVLRMADRGQFAYDLWEPFLTPDYIRALLVDGLLTTLRMAFFSVILAVVFGTIFGVGKLSDHASVRWVCWSVVEFFRAVPVLMLMIFLYFGYGAGPGGLDAFWCVVIALTLYNGSVLAEVFRAGILGRAARAVRGGVRDRPAQDPGDDADPAAAGRQDHAAGDHQPVRGGAEGHQPRLRDHRPGTHLRREADLHRLPEPAADRDRHRRDVRDRQPRPDLDRHLGAEEVRRREEDPRGVDGGGDRRGDGVGAGRALTRRDFPGRPGNLNLACLPGHAKFRKRTPSGRA